MFFHDFVCMILIIRFINSFIINTKFSKIANIKIEKLLGFERFIFTMKILIRYLWHTRFQIESSFFSLPVMSWSHNNQKADWAKTAIHLSICVNVDDKHFPTGLDMISLYNLSPGRYVYDNCVIWTMKYNYMKKWVAYCEWKRYIFVSHDWWVGVWGMI